MTGTWLAGLLRHRGGRLAMTATGVALAVALIAALGTFLAASKATMTARATRSVAVDWQVEVTPGADPAAALAAVKAAPGVKDALAVGFARTADSGPPPRAPPRRPDRASCSGCPTATAPPSPTRSASWPGDATASWSPSRPPPTCTWRPGTTCPSPCPAPPRPRRSGRRRRRPPAGELPVPEGRRPTPVPARRSPGQRHPRATGHLRDPHHPSGPGGPCLRGHPDPPAPQRRTGP